MHSSNNFINLLLHESDDKNHNLIFPQSVVAVLKAARYSMLLHTPPLSLPL